MRQITYIVEYYQNHKELKQYIEALPGSFDYGGNMLWNGRNKIKEFHIEGMEEVVIKRYKAPNFFQKVGYLFRKHKAYKAFHNGLKIMQLGIQTPAPIACVMIYNGPFISEAFYICKRCGFPPIEELLQRDDWDQALARDFARFTSLLHQKGVLHHDLNDTNVRFIKEPNGNYAFSLIDINRMDFYKHMESIPMKERIENLTRFTGRYDLFAFVIRLYAQEFGLDEDWIQQAIAQKKKHDCNWYRRKRILHAFSRKTRLKSNCII